MDLVVDVALVLLGDEVAAEQWRQACWVVAGLGSAAAIVNVVDSWPDDLASFTGRRAELRKIMGWAEGECSGAVLLAITGMPGVGKTRLAVRAGHLLMASGRVTDVRLAVDLRGYDSDRPPADPGAVLEGFLRRLGLPGDQIQHLDLAGRAARYRQLLAGRNAVILLDNAASAEQVRPLLPDSPGCFAMITSRRSLPELPTVRHLSLDVLTLEDAVELLRQAGGGVDVEPEFAAGVAELVGYLPLALALVAGRIHASPDWSPTDHLDRLLHHQRSLRIERGVEVAISLSYRDLTPDQQRAFRMLALHPGSDIGAHAAAALIDTDLPEARRRLEQLTAASLLQRVTRGRYRFHNLINTYATARSHDEDPASARRAAMTRLSDNYLHTACAAVVAIYPHDKRTRPSSPPPGTAAHQPPDQAAARKWLQTERANLLAVATHPEGRDTATVAFSVTLRRHLSMTCHLRDAQILHGHALTVARQHGDLAGEAGALLGIGDLYQRTGQYELAVDHFESALTICRDIRDVINEGRALFHLGFVSKLRGGYERAIEFNRQALACFREAEDRFGEARALGNLGWACQGIGQFERAADHYRQALAICRDLGDRDGEGGLLDDLGTIYRLTGQFERAADHHRQALTLLHEVGDREGEATALDNLGLVEQETGQLELAADHHQQALAISREIGDRDDEARALNNLGELCRRTGHHERGRDHHRQALDVYRDLGNPAGQAVALNGLGEIDRATGDLTRSLRHHAEAHDHAGKIGQRLEQARADDGLGHAHHGLGCLDQARGHWQRALVLYEELGVPDAERVRVQLAAG